MNQYINLRADRASLVRVQHACSLRFLIFAIFLTEFWKRQGKVGDTAAFDVFAKWDI
jgi:hypothetical protein